VVEPCPWTWRARCRWRESEREERGKQKSFFLLCPRRSVLQPCVRATGGRRRPRGRGSRLERRPAPRGDLSLVPGRAAEGKPLTFPLALLGIYEAKGGKGRDMCSSFRVRLLASHFSRDVRRTCGRRARPGTRRTHKRGKQILIKPCQRQLYDEAGGTTATSRGRHARLRCGLH